MTRLTGLQVGELNDSQKQWYALAICTVIVSDGAVSAEELQYLEKALSFLSVPSQIHRLIDAVRENKLPVIEKLENTEPEIRSRMLIELTQVGSSDLLLVTREMECLFRVGHLLGFPKEFVQIVVKWANESILWKKKAAHLVHAGSLLLTTQDALFS